MKVLSIHSINFKENTLTLKKNDQITIVEAEHIDILNRELTKYGYSESTLGENILLSNTGNNKIKAFDKFLIGDTELEVTKVKDISYNNPKIGKVIDLPGSAFICRVKKPGDIHLEDYAEHYQKIFKALVITLSDRASKGEYEDKSGPAIIEHLHVFFENKKVPFISLSEIIPDTSHVLTELIEKAVNDKVDLVITTGGTGIGKRDITVETVQPMLDKEIPGIMEMIRVKYGAEKPNALLSRGVAGVIEESLIYTLPGSVKAVKEYMTEIEKTLYHLFFMLHGIDIH